MFTAVEDDAVFHDPDRIALAVDGKAEQLQHDFEAARRQGGAQFLKQLPADCKKAGHRVRDLDSEHHARHQRGGAADQNPAGVPFLREAASFHIA